MGMQITWANQKILGMFSYLKDINAPELKREQEIAWHLLEHNEAMLTFIAAKLEKLVCDSHGINYFNFLSQSPVDWMHYFTDEVAAYVRENNLKVKSTIPLEVTVHTYVEVEHNPFDDELNVRLKSLGVSDGVEIMQRQVMKAFDGQGSGGGVSYKMNGDKFYDAKANPLQTWYEFSKVVSDD